MSVTLSSPGGTLAETWPLLVQLFDEHPEGWARFDHVDPSDRTTIPTARTMPVPGGRRAIGRAIHAVVHVEDAGSRTVPVPDWLSAVLLKAQAATTDTDQREKHLQDLALLLAVASEVDPRNGQAALRLLL